MGPCKVTLHTSPCCLCDLWQCLHIIFKQASTHIALSLQWADAGLVCPERVMMEDLAQRSPHGSWDVQSSALKPSNVGLPSRLTSPLLHTPLGGPCRCHMTTSTSHKGTHVPLPAVRSPKGSRHSCSVSHAHQEGVHTVALINKSLHTIDLFI